MGPAAVRWVVIEDTPLATGGVRVVVSMPDLTRVTLQLAPRTWSPHTVEVAAQAAYDRYVAGGGKP